MSDKAHNEKALKAVAGGSKFMIERVGKLMKREERKSGERMVNMVNLIGNVAPVRVDIHSELREDEFRNEGFLVVDDFQTDEEKAELDQEIKRRQAAYLAKTRAQEATSPQGRHQAELAQVAAQAASQVVQAATVPATQAGSLADASGSGKQSLAVRGGKG